MGFLSSIVIFQKAWTRMIAGTLLIPLTAAALGIALVQLRSVILGKALPGCGAKSSCDEVTSGRWSRIGVVPVAFPGAAVYFAFFISSILAHPQFPISGLRHVGFPGDTAVRVEQSLFFCAVLSAGAAVWFFALQAMVIRKFCAYCVTAQGLALLAAVLAFSRVKPVESVFLAGVAFVGVFILGQILVPAKLYTTVTAAQSEVKEIRELPEIPVTREVVVEKVVESVSPVVEEVGGSCDASASLADSAGGETGGTMLVEEVKSENSELAAVEEVEEVEAGGLSGEVEAVEHGSVPIADGGVDGTDEKLGGEVATADVGVGATGGEIDVVRVEELARRRVVVMEGKISLSARLWPVLGDPSARRLLIDMMDFTCKHCRKLHELLREMMEQKPGEWAAVLMPVPMEMGCNPTMKSTPKEHIGACEYTKLAMAVFHGKAGGV